MPRNTPLLLFLLLLTVEAVTCAAVTSCDTACHYVQTAIDVISVTCTPDTVQANGSHVSFEHVREVRLRVENVTEVVDVSGILCDKPRLRSVHLTGEIRHVTWPGACAMPAVDTLSLTSDQWQLDTEPIHNLTSQLCPQLSQLHLQLQAPVAWDVVAASNCSSLEELHLPFNRITQLQNTSLENLPHLHTLDLSNNMLSELGSLGGQLQVLNLSHNQVERLGSGQLDGLAGLRILDLSHNLLTEIEVGVFTCRTGELETVDLSYNQLTIIQPATFVDLPHLRALNLSHNQLNSIDDAAVKASEGGGECEDEEEDEEEEISGVQVGRMGVGGDETQEDQGVVWEDFHTLDLSHNNLSWGLGVAGPLRRLQVLLLGNNQLTSLPHYAIERLHALRVLSLTYNRLFWLDVGTFNNEHLEYVDLSHNRLKKIISMAFLYLPRVRRVDLSHNQLNYIYKYAFYRTCKYDQQFEVSLAHNALETDTIWRLLSTFRHLEQTTCHLLIDLSRNNITHFVQDMDRIYNVYVQTHNFRYFAAWNHVRFNLASNPITCDCLLYNEVKLLSHIQYAFAENISHADNLDFWQELNCSNAGGGSVPAVLDKMKCVAVNVRCPHMCRCQQQKGVEHLLVVNCTGQRLTHVPMLPHASNIALYLDHNAIYELMDAHHLANVSLLDLSHNALAGLGAGVLRQMPRLRTLLLHHNHLRHIPPAIQRLVTLTRFSLHNNPLACTCADAWLPHWLANHTGLLGHGRLSDVRCASGLSLTAAARCGEETLAESSGHPLLLLYAGLAAAGVLGVVLVAALVSYVVCRKSPWYTSLLARRRDNSGNFTHDVFICYSPQDGAAFFESLVTGLVDLCPHLGVAPDVNRGTQGACEQEIQAQVSCSRCTVILLSAGFLEDCWPLYRPTLLSTLHYGGPPHNLVFVILREPQNQGPSPTLGPELAALTQDYPLLQADSARMCAAQLLGHIWEDSAAGAQAGGSWDSSSCTHSDRSTLVPSQDKQDHEQQRY